MALRHWWKLDEPNATDVAVDSVGSCHLTPDATPPSVVADSRFGFVRSWGVADGVARFLRAVGVRSSSGGNGTVELFVPSDSPLNVEFVGGEWSLSWWMNIGGNITTTSGLFYCGKPDNQTCTHLAPAAVHATGHAHAFWVGHLNVHVDTSEVGQWRWCYGSNAQRSGNNGSNPIPNYGVWLHHAIVRNGANVEFWCNGALIAAQAWVSEPYTPQDNYDDPGLAPGPDVFWIGGTASSASATFKANLSKLAHVRIYNHALTASELLGLAIPEPDPDTSAPVISNVTPAHGSAIGRNSAWAFRVTDNTAFRRVIVTATMNGHAEVVWTGTAFSAVYLAASFRTAVVEGTSYDFSIRRAGGWPAAPTFDVYAIDTAGNEGT